jgi:hypothetical protein
MARKWAEAPWKIVIITVFMMNELVLVEVVLVGPEAW